MELFDRGSSFIFECFFAHIIYTLVIIGVKFTIFRDRWDYGAMTAIAMLMQHFVANYYKM
jgi:hypothetical protein